MAGVTEYFGRMVPYDPPPWAKRLKNVPSHRMIMAQLTTPYHKWDLPGIPKDIDLYIKRDDMTGSFLTGNKVRKLEFLMADAVQKGCKHLITCGGIESNFCRAAAIAGRTLGLEPHLFLRAAIDDPKQVATHANVLLNRMCGADMYIVPKWSLYKEHLKPRMEHLAQKIKRETGEDSYLMPTGGSCPLGLYGYLNCFKEMIDQGLYESFDDIIFACGSGGTGEGLSVANYLTGSKVKIHGVVVSHNQQHVWDYINEALDEIGLGQETNSKEIIDAIDGHIGEGYGLSSQEEIEFVVNVALKTGVLLDPVYTGKSVKGLVYELNHNPGRFKGKRVLYIHTGGAFGLYDGRMGPTVARPGDTSKIRIWNDQNKPPF